MKSNFILFPPGRIPNKKPGSPVSTASDLKIPVFTPGKVVKTTTKKISIHCSPTGKIS